MLLHMVLRTEQITLLEKTCFALRGVAGLLPSIDILSTLADSWMAMQIKLSLFHAKFVDE